MTAATWVVAANWTSEASPDFTDTGEVITTRVQNRDGITMVRGRDTIRALAPPAAGSCDLTLNNQSKDYSPENASSPLFGKLIPGVPVRVTTTAPSATNVWRGVLDDLPQQPLLRGGFVQLPCLGTLAKLKGTKVYTPLYTSVTTSAALTTLFAAAGLAAAEYTMLDTGKTTLTYWWCNGDDAFDMAARILAAEGPGAALYENGAGVITFHSRHYRLLTTRCTTSQVTFGNATTEPKHAPPFGYNPNLKGVVNSCDLQVATLSLAGSNTLLATWNNGGTIDFTAGQARDLTFTLSAPATNFDIVTPSNLTFARMESFDSSSGVRVVATITSAQDYTETVGPIQLWGKTYSTDTALVEQSADSSASQAKYGVRPLPTSYNPWPYIDPLVAEGFCDAIVGAYQEPRATIDITVNNGHSTRLTHMLTREISDRVTVQESQTGMSGAVIIERIRHEVKEGGRDHKTIFSCEKVGVHDAWLIWDAGSWDVNYWAY